MKIICTKKELAELIRACYVGNENGERCPSCVLCAACSRVSSETPLEDMCEVDE